MTQQEIQKRLKAIGFLMKDATPEQMPRLQAEIDALIGFSSGDEQFQEDAEKLAQWELTHGGQTRPVTWELINGGHKRE